jgi:cysteine desulfurase
VSGYFDAATAAPLHPAARAALEVALEDGWADPDRSYREGRRARLLLDGSREAIAAVLGARPDEVTFTPSGTVAAHLAVLGALAARRQRPRRVVTSAVEHSSVLAAVAAGTDETTTVGVDALGSVDAEAYAAELGAGATLACLQSANHEVGTLQPVAEVLAAGRERGVPVLVDAAASLGRTAPPPDWDLLVASARKWGGPPGVGVLGIRTGVRWRSPGPEDAHESGRAAGVVPLPLVLAAAAALEAADAERSSETARLRDLTERIRTRLPELVPDVEVLGHPTSRLPHLVAFSCLYVAGEALAVELDREGFSVSSGSSCSASSLTPSHVLVAMGALTHGNVRVSLHRDVTEADVDRFLAVLPGIVDELRRTAGAESL